MPTITPEIVQISTVLTVAPAPSTLQQSGAIISVGGTTLAINAYQFCAQLSDLTSLLSATGNFAELTNMATTFFANGSAVGFYVLELGVQTTVDNAIYALESWITANPKIFYSYLVPANWDSSKDEVGSVKITAGGTGYTSDPSVVFSAPTSGTTATGTAVIQNGIVISVTVTNPGSGYTSAPTVTFSGGGGSGATATSALANSFNILASNYASPTGKTYFFGTTSSATIGNYTNPNSLALWAPSPNAPSTEFGAASMFYNWLVNLPSATNQLSNMAFRFLYGVTPWPASGYSTQIETILSSYGNLAFSGQGGITETYLLKGTMMDGTQMSSWYGLNWYQINVKQALDIAVINGSNEQPPLLYDQPGVNTLTAVANQVGKNAVSFGCALNVSLVPTPFYTYTNQNPLNYSAGLYGGFLASVNMINGFMQIDFLIDAIQFA